jgi:transposase
MGNDTISIDLRKRILKAYDRGDGTQEEVARRFEVSYGMVKKLIQQRRRLGDIAPQHHRSGRKALITPLERNRLRRLVTEDPDLTLSRMREALGLTCTIQAIHYVLADLGLTYKKRRSGPANKTGRGSPVHAGRGGASKAASTPNGSSSSTNRVRKQT